MSGWAGRYDKRKRLGKSGTGEVPAQTAGSCAVESAEYPDSWRRRARGGRTSQVVLEAATELGDLGTFNPRSIATLVGLAFMGGESMLLLGDAWTDDVFAALSNVGTLLKRDRKEAA